MLDTCPVCLEDKAELLMFCDQCEQVVCKDCWSGDNADGRCINCVEEVDDGE